MTEIADHKDMVDGATPPPSDKNVLITYRFSWALASSLLIHVLLIAAVIFASISTKSVLLPMEQTDFIKVIMLNNNPSSSITNVSEPIEKRVTLPEQEIPEQVVKPVVTPTKPVKTIKPKAIEKEKVKKQITKIRKPDNPILPEKLAEQQKQNNIQTALAVTQKVASQILTKQPVASTNKSIERVSLPKALSRVQPSYPERARVLGTEGQVKVQFDVDSEGRVINIRILSATPKNVFEREIKQAMRRWRYEAKAAHNLVVTIIFNLNGDTELQ